MRPTNRLLSFAGLATAALLFAAACSSAATPAASVLGTTETPMAPVASQAPTSLTISVTNDATLGAYLTGQNGMTLYHFTNDTPDTSACTGTCATKWPPLVAAAGATITPPAGATGAFTLITRPDGTMQVAYNHQPLYYYSGDSVAGDTTGQGYIGKWFVAPLTPGSGSQASPSAMAPTSAPTAAASQAASGGYGY